MTVTDPIADMLTRIRNGAQSKHEVVSMPASKLKAEVLRILVEEGFIEGYRQTKNDSGFDSLEVQLHYLNDDTPGIAGLKRVSKPGLRIHVGKGEIPTYYGGLGVSIISTSKGVMTGRQAWENGVGGELLCQVW